MATTPSTKVFNSHNPVTGEPVGTFPIYSAKEVSEIVDFARHASTAWVNLDFPGRKKV